MKDDPFATMRGKKESLQHSAAAAFQTAYKYTTYSIYIFMCALAEPLSSGSRPFILEHDISYGIVLFT